MNKSNDDALLGHVKRSVELSFEAKREFYRTHSAALVEASRCMAETFLSGGKALIFGNGGSAADAQHMAAEMTGRMLVERKKPLPAIALTTDTSALTAIANDYGYDDIFLFQLKALGRKGDLAIAISTSGNSKNVLRAVDEARRVGMRVVSLTGKTGGKLKELSDINLNVEKGMHASMIQETHITVVHLLVDLMDRFLLPPDYIG
ncbi:MAG: SIS domain-containing protein [Deltaproteobacteria bacterium]|nr:SIS domain-containing protein [Deltaproteobacteria bacterium]